MKIYCEVCGSVDILRDDSGLFVCQDCGARYTAEAMRELVGVTSQAGPKNPVTIDGRIESFFGSRDYASACELYEGVDDKDTLEPATTVYGGLSRVAVKWEEGNRFEASTVLRSICLAYGDALDKHKDILRSDKVNKLLQAATMSFVLAGELYAGCGKALVAMQQAGELDARQCEKELGELDQLAANRDVNTFLALKRVAGYVVDGYVPSAEQRKIMSDLWESTEYFNRNPYMQMIAKRVISTERTARFVADDADTGTLLDAARKALANGGFDVSQRLYERVLAKDGENHEAKFFSAALDGLSYYVPLVYNGWVRFASAQLGCMPLKESTNALLGHPTANHLSGRMEVNLLEFAAAVINLTLVLTKQNAMTVAERYESETPEGTHHSDGLGSAIGGMADQIEGDWAEALLDLVEGLTFVVDFGHYTLTDKAESDSWEEMYQRTPPDKRDEYWTRNHDKFLKYRL